MVLGASDFTFRTYGAGLWRCFWVTDIMPLAGQASEVAISVLRHPV